MSDFYQNLLTQPEGKTLEFKQHGFSLKRFTVPLPKILPLSREQSRKSESTQLGHVSEKVEAQVEVQVRAQVKAQVKAQVEAEVNLEILSTCLAAPKSSAEIAAALGHKQLSGNLRKALPQLRECGLLEYTIPEKPNSRLQQYRLSTKGRALLTSAGMTKGNFE